MVWKMNLQSAPFISILNGTKDIELRLNDPKRQQIQISDVIEFKNVLTGDILNTVVVDKHIFKSFAELYAIFDKIRLGYKENEQAHPDDMERYYSKEDIEKYGVVGIEIRVYK
ncbi:MAG: RNA-binding protein [Clostridia bacterium]|nr:RNA-binding protein [Clostridia bacterium]